MRNNQADPPIEDVSPILYPLGKNCPNNPTGFLLILPRIRLVGISAIGAFTGPHNKHSGFSE
jgi:hypothetical protein